MEWLDRHHVAVVRTATGVVLVASAITGVVGSMTFHDLAQDNAAKQAQIDALARQLGHPAPSASPSSPAQAGSGGTKAVAKPSQSPSPQATVLLLANAQSAPVVPAQDDTQSPGAAHHVPLGGPSATARPTSPGGGSTGHTGGTPTPEPSPSPSRPPQTSLAASVSVTLTPPLAPRPQPSQSPLLALLVPVVRRNA